MKWTMRVLDLNDFFYFVQVVDRSGFTAAGRILRIPKSTLSHRIQRDSGDTCFISQDSYRKPGMSAARIVVPGMPQNVEKRDRPARARRPGAP
jgi:hypothetical protein